MISPYRIMEVKRFQRKIIVNNERKLIPKQTVLLTFEGNILASRVFINYVACKVEPYVQRVTQCFKCLRFGHVVKQCNSTSNLCINCSKEKYSEHQCRYPQDIYILKK